jgi:hypothetical protein
LLLAHRRDSVRHRQPPQASLEDDGTPAVQQDAVLGMPAHGPGERDPLGVAPISFTPCACACW